MKNYDSLEELERLLKLRLEEWFLNEKSERSQPKPVVTITQEPGCGAETIAERLCSELDLHLYDWELVEQIAKHEQVSALLVSTLEKNPPSGFADFLADLAPEYGLTSYRYISSLKRILLSIAVTGNALIMGRGSNFFLPSEKKIGLCFVAPLELRIKNVMKELGVTEKEARRHVSKTPEAGEKISPGRYSGPHPLSPCHQYLSGKAGHHCAALEDHDSNDPSRKG
ncbi:MAG TPA: cytidylate kinase-like family protein [Acidobacteriota bacterium]|nr:cytidylate kinase-like family protein [Acidobacteriota bacterium]